jgi:class 3 adenylate cyclase/tetratricopeptide (TPR) repeat protein
MSDDHHDLGPAAVNPVAAWLQSLGLERYAPMFESHGIDLHSLPLLAESELAELGVLLGHRRLLLKGIATLDGARFEPVAATLPARDAERRQLTVLFCDLVGSTALAQRLDAEVLRELMHAYQQCCGGVIARYDGHVAQYRGDGLFVYFGFPQAHEDDAERAVRAALEIVPAVNRLFDTEPLQVRIGIATGPVVVGESGAGDASVPSAAVGETPNVAARLLALASPDQIVIAPSTHRLLGNTFEIEDLGDHKLKGIDVPVRARRIRGLARSESRFDATRSARYTPFVGREHEVALLLARWEHAREGEGQVVLLAGEPGIGKSRIAQVLRERLADTPHLRLQYQCSPYHSGSAFYPLIEQLTRAAGFERDDTPERKLDRLEAILALSAEELPTIGPLFAALLSLPIDRYPPRMLSPQKHKELTIAALVDQPVRLGKQQPVLMICEDAHWIDPSTLETMALMVERIRHAAILLVVTCRPEFVPPWTGHGNVTLLHLNRLSKRHGAAMTDRLTGGKALPDEVLTQILERTDGVPLFVEELTKAVLEADFLHDAGDRWELSGPLPPLAIPSTLQDSLMARLDRLAPPIKEVAQIGACIGREFDHELLAAVAPTSAGELHDALDKLVASGLIFRQGSVPEATYSFKHALVQDVAYDGLLKSRRQQIHGRIARSLVADFKDRAKARPELLALHLTRAGLIDQALPQWRTAARSAIANNRHREALGYVDAGLALVDRASVELRASHEVGLLVSGAGCHWVLTGYACEAAAALWARAEALLEGVTDQRLLILALMGINICAYAGADTRKALATAERLVSLGQATSDTDSKVVAFAAVGPTLYQQGQYEHCKRLLEFVVETYETDRRTGYGRLNDAKVTACSWLSWIHLTAGRLDQARHYARMAIDHASAIAQPFVLTQALSVGVRPFAEAGDCEEALDLCRRCIELCDAQNLPFWKGWAMVYEGVAQMRLGQHVRAEERLAQAIAHLVAGGGRSDLGHMYAWRTLALAHLGRFDEARRDYEVGRADCVETGQLLALTELAYARGVTELLDPGAEAGAAEHWLHAALTDARSSGMRLIELRAATALARLWRQQGKPHQARELLAPLYGCFTEGFECADLKEARVLLEQLDAGR